MTNINFCHTIFTHNQVQYRKGLIQELTINDHQEELLWSPNFSRAFFYKEFCLAYTVLDQKLKILFKCEEWPISNFVAQYSHIIKYNVEKV